MTEEHTSPKALKWIAAALVTANVFMALLDSTIVSIVLPKMMSTFEVDLYDVQWVVISYFLGSVIGMSCVGWLGDHYGTKAIFLLGVATFTILSAVCGMAGTINIMNVARFIQGIGEGFILPTGLVILYAVFPKEERGLAMGLYGLGAAFAPAIGPGLGGFITEHLSWRWIFYINLPIGLLSFVGGWFYLARGHYGHERRRFDLVGFTLMCVAFSSLVLFTTKGQEKGWLQSDFILGLVIVFAISFPLLIIWSLRSSTTLLNFRLFSDRTFASCTITFCLVTFSIYGIWILLPVYLERLRNFSTFTAGLILLPGAIAGGFSILITGVLVDRWRPKALLLIALAGCSVTSFLYQTDLWVSKHDIAWQYSVWFIFVAAAFTPLNALSLSTLPVEKLNMGSTVLNVFRLLFGSIGTAYSTSLLNNRMANYYTVLSAKANYGEPAARTLIANVLSQRGEQVDTATVATIRSVIRDYITANSAGFSFEAVFKILGVWFGVALLVALFIKAPQRLRRSGPAH
jgi:DHA2 family multidrug resistance protein